MEFQFQLTTIDWTAISAIGQLVIAVLTLASLVYIIFQAKNSQESLEIARKQTEIARQQLDLAAEQLRAAKEQVEEERHNSVLPDVIISFASVESPGPNHGWGPPKLRRNDPRLVITLGVKNVGLGMAKDVHFEVLSDPPVSSNRVMRLPPDSPTDKIQATCEITSEATVVLRWFGLYNRPYSASLTVVRDDSGVSVHELDSEGRVYRTLGTRQYTS